jgi:hypothetical protein
MKMFEVGGCVRDEILGVPSKDIDFTVVMEDIDIFKYETRGSTPFDWMVYRLDGMGFKIFLETPEFLTVRAQFPRVKNMTNTVRVLDRITEGLTFGLGYKP